MGKGIPEGWMYCPKKSNLIANRFVAFKTPLDQKFETIPESFKFTPKIFLEWMKRTEVKLYKIMEDVSFVYSNRFFLSLLDKTCTLD